MGVSDRGGGGGGNGDGPGNGGRRPATGNDEGFFEWRQVAKPTLEGVT